MFGFLGAGCCNFVVEKWKCCKRGMEMMAVVGMDMMGALK
jgi:hypothetical protein